MAKIRMSLSTILLAPSCVSLLALDQLEEDVLLPLLLFLLRFAYEVVAGPRTLT